MDLDLTSIESLINSLSEDMKISKTGVLKAAVFLLHRDFYSKKQKEDDLDELLDTMDVNNPFWVAM